MDKIDRATYLANIGVAFDNGVSDANETKPKQPYEGAYAAGFDSGVIAQAIRPVVVNAASRGWDDGASGAARNDTPNLQTSFGNTNVITDLKATYDQAYDLSKSYATQKTSGWTYLFTAAAVAVAAWAGWTYAMPAMGLRAARNPTSSSYHHSKGMKGSGWEIFEVESIDDARKVIRMLENRKGNKGLISLYFHQQMLDSYKHIGDDWLKKQFSLRGVHSDGVDGTPWDVLAVLKRVAFLYVQRNR